MAVKMRPTYCRTKRPRGALLQLDIEKYRGIVENRWEVAARRPSVKYHSSFYVFLTKICLKRILGQCLVGSLTGAVACSRVMQAYQGRLSADGNRAGRIKAKAGLTARLAGRAGTKVGLSDPRIRRGDGPGLTDKSYPGDNRLVVPESPYRRHGSAP